MRPGQRGGSEYRQSVSSGDATEVHIPKMRGGGGVCLGAEAAAAERASRRRLPCSRRAVSAQADHFGALPDVAADAPPLSLRFRLS
jgi:hypothetical protein